MHVRKTYCIIEAPSNCGSHHECWQEITSTLKSKGWKETKNTKKSGIILLRQCCMTTEEIDVAIETIIKLEKQNLQAKIFLGECISRTKELVEVIQEKFPKLEVYPFTTPQEFFAGLGEPYEKQKGQNVPIVGDRAAIVNISNGCNRKCAFCKMCYMDFSLECVPLETVLEKIWLAKEKGARKIVLNAMNSTQYLDKGRRFHDLLKAVLEVPDMFYQVNGIVMAELTDEALEVLKNDHFFHLQMEVQSFIPEVREHMGLGEISNERILYILEQMRSKHITSNIMTGFYREREKGFQEQLDIIRKNNLFFLSTTYLVATPGTKAATLNNPTASQAQERIIEFARVISELRSKIAEEMIGKEQGCMVISENMNGSILFLADNGVLIRGKRAGLGLRMGQRLSVIPHHIESLFGGVNQNFILSVEEETPKCDEAEMYSYLFAIGQKKMEGAKKDECFNRTDSSLKQYCQKKFAEELNKKIRLR